MKRSRKQIWMVILYAAAVLCFAFGDAFKITALLWVMLGLLVAGSVLLILLGRFRTPKDELFEKSDMQAQVFERERF